jgi:hypothetical protein
MNTERGGFIGYEYKSVVARYEMGSIWVDGMENFGWRLESGSDPRARLGSSVLKFKRDRKIRNKAELTRLQRQFESQVSEVVELEASKTRKATIVALIIGLVGTAFIAGSTFAITDGWVMACIVLAIPGFAGWILPYLCFKTISRKEGRKADALIEQGYDEIYETCQKGNQLL